MSNAIKDYLHLCLGRMCVLPNNNIYILTAVRNGDLWPIVKDPNTGIEMACPPNDIIPFLRLLTSMTEEEALELCAIASPAVFGDYRYKKWQVKKHEKSNADWQAYIVTNEKSTHEFNIDLIDGDIRLFNSDGSDEPDESLLMDYNYRFWYPKNGFDIFGLIEARLAGRLT